MTRIVKQTKPRKRCPSCGAFNTSDTAMCEMCGYAFSDVSEAVRPKPAPSPTSKPVEDDLDEDMESPPEIDAAPLPRRPPNLPYWRPKPKPTSRVKQRFGVLIGVVVLVIAALVGIGLVISGLNRMREEVSTVMTPSVSPQPLVTTSTGASEPVLSSDQDEARPLPTPTLQPTPTSSPTPEPTRPPRQTYVVQSGDSCFAIATRFGVQVSDIIVWNNLPDNCLIRPGQELFVSPP